METEAMDIDPPVKTNGLNLLTVTETDTDNAIEKGENIISVNKDSESEMDVCLENTLNNNSTENNVEAISNIDVNDNKEDGKTSSTENNGNVNETLVENTTVKTSEAVIERNTEDNTGEATIENVGESIKTKPVENESEITSEDTAVKSINVNDKSDENTESKNENSNEIDAEITIIKETEKTKKDPISIDISDDSPQKSANVDESEILETSASSDKNEELKDSTECSVVSSELTDGMQNTKESSEKDDSKKDKEKKKKKTCPECGQKKKLKFKIVFKGKSHQMCSEDCYKNFKEKMVPSKISPPAKPVDQKCISCNTKIEPEGGFFPIIGDIKALCSEECLKKHHDKNAKPKACAQCKKQMIKPSDLLNRLNWETMTFCDELCLGKYQAHLGSHCTCCQTPVPQTSLGKYCVCFGADIRQFCSGSCLEEFKKGLKVCSFCQTDLSAGTDGFLAPVGDKGQFKDFCSQQCMERYEVMNSLTKNAPEVQECANCKKQGSFKMQAKHQEKVHSLCCDLCVSAFRCTYQISDNMCNTCFKFFTPESDKKFEFFFDNLPRHFCTKACLTLYVLAHRKITQCAQCKVKKYTFDMIEKSETSQVFCSLTCFALFRANATNSGSQKLIRCDHCNKNSNAQYHLTMSDNSMRNFCTYQCVLNFQNQFTNIAPLTTTASVRTTPTAVKPVPKPTVTTTPSFAPVINSVISLSKPTRMPTPTADKTPTAPVPLTSIRPFSSSLNILSAKPQTTTLGNVTVTSNATSNSSQVVREVVVRPPVPKSVKNKAASCRPIMMTKAVSCRSTTCNKSVQTDDRPMPIILPVPVPVYVPTPFHMFSRPVPCPIPFPVPVPVPIFIRQDKNSKEMPVDLVDNVPNFSDVVSADASICEEGINGTSVVFDDANNVAQFNQESCPITVNNAVSISADAFRESAPAPTKRKADEIENDLECKKMKPSETEPSTSEKTGIDLVNDVFDKLDEGTDSKLKVS